MEIIKKKICLENFISRIPGKIKTIEGNDNKNGSWGKIPHSIIFGSENSKTIKYHAFINLYYSVLNIIMYCDYYEYDEKMALINEEIAGLDTIYIRAGEFGNVSSSLVMELMEHGKDVSKFLPPEVIDLVKNN